MPSRHKEIQDVILEVCNKLGFNAVQEYRGRGWRADVLAINGVSRFAFEIQISPQSLKTTLERQAKYIQEGIDCCWLFEKSPRRDRDELYNEVERPDLPLFSIESANDDSPDSPSFVVSLNGRRKIALPEFVGAFLQGRIKFCKVLRTKKKQLIRLFFFEMKCWKCGALNHVYSVDETCLRSSCNGIVQTMEMMEMWSSNGIEYIPEVIGLAQNFARTKNLKLGQIKRRYSKTVGDSYISFGCYKCDSIFGDYYVSDAALEAAYDPKTIRLEGEIDLHQSFEIPVPHWCYPGPGESFCDGTKNDPG